MANELQGKRVAFLATDMVEQVELTEPWKAVEEAGATPELISLEEGEIQAFNHYDKGDTFTVDKTVEEARADDYDALVIPGGVGNPDTMRVDENAVELTRQFFEQGKPVGVICHGPWMLVEAGVVRGRTVTSWPSLQTDIRNAGGNWVDQEVAKADPADFDGLVLPGGVANPDFLRGDDNAVGFVRRFFEQGKPVGVICHGPWTLVEAGVVKGRKITSWPTLKTDIGNAGGNWVDEEVVVDAGLVSSRNPDDLPAFCAKIVEEFAEGRHEQQAASVRADASSS